MIEAPFTRVLKGGEKGIDVEGIGRALARADVGYVSLRTYNRMPLAWRRTYGLRKQAAVNAIRKREGRVRNDQYDRGVHGVLLDAGAFDANATNKMILWEPPATLVHPIPRGWDVYSAQYLHETGGLPGNWAIDWIVPELTGNLTPVVAVIDAKITRLSGSAPNADTPDYTGVYGWTVHYESKGGYRWFWTHFGRRRDLTVGQRVRPGEIIGWVGDQRWRPDHIHGGVTSPLGEADARRKIKEVASAPRVMALA